MRILFHKKLIELLIPYWRLVKQLRIISSIKVYGQTMYVFLNVQCMQWHGHVVNENPANTIKYIILGWGESKAAIHSTKSLAQPLISQNRSYL